MASCAFVCTLKNVNMCHTCCGQDFHTSRNTMNTDQHQPMTEYILLLKPNNHSSFVKSTFQVPNAWDALHFIKLSTAWLQKAGNETWQERCLFKIRVPHKSNTFWDLTHSQWWWDVAKWQAQHFLSTSSLAVAEDFRSAIQPKRTVPARTISACVHPLSTY